MTSSVPTVAFQRLKKDYQKLLKEPVPYMQAAPLESNILEWRYIIFGAPKTPYEGGVYQGKLLFPKDFPFKPPAIMMITPNGRFQTNTRLCLSISDYHPDTWNPAWTVSTIITGLMSFMNDNQPTLGSLVASESERKLLARKSKSFNLKDRTFCQLFPEEAEKIREELEKLERENTESYREMAEAEQRNRMSGELKHHIKTENAPSRLDLVPLHQRPPPYPLEPLPEPDPSRKMSLEQFLQLQKRGNGFQKVGSNELLKCIILSEIEKIPEMWKLDRSVRINNARHYPHVAIEVYKRTGVLVTALSVKMAFKMAKDGLRARLRSAIVGRKFGPVETEQYLWKWPLYGYCRFFRQSTVSVEEKFRKEAAKNPACYVINDDVENEDDVEIEEESAMEVQEEQYEDADVILESTSASYYPDYSQQQSMMTSPNTKMLYYGEMSNFQPERPESVPKAPSPKLPTFEVNFREEMSQITYQAARIAREQPESVKLLRKALFDTVLAFDDKPYTNVGDVFRDLADRHQK